MNFEIDSTCRGLSASPFIEHFISPIITQNINTAETYHKQLQYEMKQCSIVGSGLESN